MFERPASRWFGRIALAVIGPIITVELILQFGALFTPKQAATAPSTPDRPADAPCLALCVGDSFTYGLGASKPDGSYPSQLEAALRAAPLDGRWRVANGGVPGRNSRDVLLDLPRQFRRERPRFVVILVGCNDPWSRPDPASIDEAARDPSEPPGWRLEWRTRKLFLLLFRGKKTAEGFAGMGERAPSAKKPAPAPAGAKPPAEMDAQYFWHFGGRWSLGGETIVFERDGRMRRGDAQLHWSLERAGVLHVTKADGSAEIVGAKRVGHRLLLTPPGATAPVILEPLGPEPGTPPQPKWYPEFDRRFSAKDFAGTLEWTERWIAEEPDNPTGHNCHMRAADALQHRELLDADLAALERIHRQVGTCEAAEALLNGLVVMGDFEREGKLVREQLERFPASSSLRAHAAAVAERAGDEESALREMRKAIELGGETSGSYLAYQQRECSRFASHLGRPAEGAADLIRAMRADLNPDLDRQAILRAQFDERAFEAAFAATEATPDERTYFTRRLSEARDAASDKPSPVMIDHLRQMARWCREQGAEVLLCTYPWNGGSIERAQRAAAEKEHVRFVDLATRFDVLLRTRKREELFVPDGHCNDAGYAIIAEEIAAALRAASSAR